MWNAPDYARHARFVPEYGEEVVTLLAPRPGERILDLGCGDGTLAAKMVQLGAEVVGVDASADFVEAARRRGIGARLEDAQALTFSAEFDAVFSNAALHWMPRIDDVLAGVYRALRAGGRFIGELGGQGNVAAIHTALVSALRARGIAEDRSPWFFPTRAGFERMLERHGFEVRSSDLFARPTPLETGMRNWLETFAAPFASGFDSAQRASFLDDVATLVAPALRDDEGCWTADYVRLRFAATKPR